MSDALRFEDLEADFGELRDAFGGLVVARHRGMDVSALARAYVGRRVALAPRLANALDGSASGVEQAGLASIRSTLAWMDEFEPVDRAASGLTGATAPNEAADADLRRRTVEAYGDAVASIRVGSETIDRLTALGRLATEPDAAIRRETFAAMQPIWRAVDGGGGADSPYRRLLRSSAARWSRDGSPVEAAAMALGIAPGSFEPMLRELLARWRDVLGPEAIEPWDYRVVVGAMERRLGQAVPRDRLRTINDAHLASLGADPTVLGIRYDVDPRPDRPPIPVAFTISEDVARQDADGSWQAATPWVFATYATGGLGNLEELVHESGHALHYASIRARPAFFEPPVEAGGLVEGIADLLGWDVHEPAFQARHLETSVDLRESRLGRYGGVMLDVCWALFEIELHRNPGRSPNEAWTSLTEETLGIVPHPEWSWWAVRGQLVESPGYMANYALAAIVAAALRGRIRELRGDWLADTGDPGWYPFVTEHLLRFGAERPPADVLKVFLGGHLTADALLDDLALAR